MTEKEKIQAFCSKHEQAIVGVSRDKKKFGNLAFKELRKRGYQVYPVNPNAASIEDVPCYKSVYELPDSVQHVVILTPPQSKAEVYTRRALIKEYPIYGYNKKRRIRSYWIPYTNPIIPGL